MSALSIVVLSLSMAADAFAAAMARGASQRPRFLAATRAGALFGVVEAVNVAAGWMLGMAASSYITAIDHWIAFVLLGGVGLKMMHEGLQDPDETEQDVASARNRTVGLVATAIGTSIDSAAIGITLAFLDADIRVITVAIGLATFALATTGMMLGRIAGVRFGKTVEIVAGCCLVTLGAKILLEHLGFLG